ncbi:MAG: hypothetical protein AAGI38_11365 [Bacteroidota bacterium]
MRYSHIFFLLLLGSQLLAQTPNLYEERVTSAGNIGTTISNLGLIGNSFSGSFNIEGKPSCEYPVGSGIEHIFNGGLWVGGNIGGANGIVAVSTGAGDDPTGYATGKANFEFTSTTPIRERSSLFDSPFFDPNAVSHQDFVSTFTDSAIFIRTGTGRVPIQDHLNPMKLEIQMETYNWNFSFSNFFVILNFTLTNVNTVPIDSVYIGYWMNDVVRNVNITPPGGTPFYNKGGNGFIDSLGMGYGYDAAGDVGFTDSYVGLKYLGSEKAGRCVERPDFNVYYNTWQFRNTADPRYFFPVNDLQKYGKMSNGLNFLEPTIWNQIQQDLKIPNNRSTLVSVGPYGMLMPGESIQVAFAIVTARRVFDGNPVEANTAAQRGNLIQNAGWAQTAYDGEDLNGNCILDPGEDRDGNARITRFILPSPPDVPRTKVIAKDKQIEVYWSDNSEASVDPISKQQDFEGYRIYKTALGFDVQNVQDVLSSLELISAWDNEGNNIAFETGLEDIRLAEPVKFDDDTVTYHYRYTFDNITNGWQHVIALTAFDQGDPINNLQSLESAPLANLKRVFAGKPGNDGFTNGDPFAYPNPYYAGAAWEGSSRFEEDRKLYFANLPPRCEIRVYTLAGDLVDVIQHDEATYDGSDSRWFQTYSDPETAVFSGGEHAWDLLSQDTQILARGLYLFVVIDKDTGEKRRGKFVLIK